MHKGMETKWAAFTKWTVRPDGEAQALNVCDGGGTLGTGSGPSTLGFYCSVNQFTFNQTVISVQRWQHGLGHEEGSTWTNNEDPTRGRSLVLNHPQSDTSMLATYLINSWDRGAETLLSAVQNGSLPFTHLQSADRQKTHLHFITNRLFLIPDKK